MIVESELGPDNHELLPEETSVPDLIAWKAQVRTLAASRRKSLMITPAGLAAGYLALLARAPRRSKPYFSATRAGIAPPDPHGRRKEERLAMAWFNAGSLLVEGESEPYSLLDYQFPLKSALADRDIGKIDLLGFRATDDALAVIELKVGGNAEDRRTGLLEGLIYAAILEANADTIFPQIGTTKGHRVGGARPNILLAAPANYWHSGYPSLTEILSLVASIEKLLPISIRILSYDDRAEPNLALSGGRPLLTSNLLLSPVSAPCRD